MSLLQVTDPPPRVVLCGNPNTGKTSIFNRLTGLNMKVGNYPGVTVERIEASLRLPDGRSTVVCDLPGTCSLTARSAEEQIAILAIAGIPPLSPPEVTVIVADATQLSRSLYLVLQVIETGGPAIVALNMVDQLARQGLSVDVEKLSGELGVPVVPVSGLSGAGIDDLRRRIAEVLDDPDRARAEWGWAPHDEALAADVDAVASQLPEDWLRKSPARRGALALWSLMSIDEHDELDYVSDELRRVVQERHAAAHAAGRDLDEQIVRTRYDWIDARVDTVLVRGAAARSYLGGDRIDSVMLHPWIGFALFLVVMGVVFQSLFSWSEPAIEVVEAAVGWLAQAANSLLPDGRLREFVVEGVIAGVGSVLVFLPQILLLFFFIGLMEDTGYMARVAFLMDRLMRHLGLNGRAFVPMLSGYACAVPAILATRTMERQRDRLLTMMVVPLMTCSARLPVYTLVIGALFPPSRVFGFVPVQGLLMVAMYLFSTVTALVAAAVIGRTLLRGGSAPLILELPAYRRPRLRSVLRMMWLRSSLFLREAGGVILVCTIVLWALLSFPHAAGETDSDRLQGSYGARLGRMVEPVLEPLGFDWKIGVGILGAFAAREVFVSTLGVVYGVGDVEDSGSPTLRQRIRDEMREDGRPVYTPLTGLSLMVFFALACQCMSTLAVVRRETRSWRWPVFLFGYMTVLAWVASFAVYQGGRLLGFP